MRLLLIDTCGGVGSVALAETGPGKAEVVAAAVLPGRSASERLVPEVRDLMAGVGWSLAGSGAGLGEGVGVGEGLGAIVVVHGPGSFTGVRVGLSAALGLSEAGGVPLVVVSRLAVLGELGVLARLGVPAGPGMLAEPRGVAGNPPRGGGAWGEARGVVHALLDAGRGEFYWGEYGPDGGGREALLSRDEVDAAAGAGGMVVACEARVAEAVAALSPVLVAEPVAGDALRLAMGKIVRGEFADAMTVEANYLRRTSAEIFAKPKAAMAKAAVV